MFSGFSALHPALSLFSFFFRLQNCVTSALNINYACVTCIQYVWFAHVFTCNVLEYLFVLVACHCFKLPNINLGFVFSNRFPVISQGRLYD